MRNISKVVYFLTIFSVCLRCSTADVNSFTIKCNFEFPQPTVYSCGLSGVVIEGDEKTNFIIDVSGHLEGLTNENVSKIEIYGGSVPFIITELFSTFRNIRFLSISPSGLTRIQSFAFEGAHKLESFVSYRNPLRYIDSHAFSGASNLYDIDLSINELEKISEEAFIGLENLRFLNLGGNKLRELHQKLFQPLTGIVYLQLAMNELTNLEGNTFSNNRFLHDISIQNNQINSIGKGFLDGLDNLLSLNLLHNNCADFHWIINESTTIKTVQAGLQTCFDNFAPPIDEVRKFVLELRGSLAIYDENGKEILRL